MKLSVWAYYAVLFISSACIMTLELIAGRVAAPYIGVSLYTWTGIIAAVLAGMSAGNLVGGRLADRIRPRRLLGLSLVASAALAALILPMAAPLMGGLVPQDGPPLIRIFLPSLLLFGIPCLALAVISPAVYKLALRDLNRLGGTVGRLSASGILGSIVGTYVTGFYLVPSFGVRAIVLGVAVALLLLGLAVLAVLARTDPAEAPSDDPATPAGVASCLTPNAAPMAAPVAGRLSLLPVLAFLFLASAAIMAMEMVGGRLLAPNVGANLYTWTSVIGAVLLGMTLGGLAGGYLADRFPPRITLGLVFALGGATCALILALGPALLVALLPNSLPPLLGIGLPTLALLLPPTLILGLASPLCYKLAIADTVHVGRIAGALGAAGALGSIFGTLTAGYWLVPTFGSLATAFGVAVLLMVLATIGLWPRRTAAVLTAVAAVVLLVGTILQPTLLLHPFCQVESAYFCIRVSESPRPGAPDPIKVLVLDHLVHAGYNVSQPEQLWYEYEQVAAWVLQAWNRPNLKTLFLGGGGYLLPYWVEKNLPGSAVDVAEIDPAVTRTALREFVPKARNIRTYPGDARMVLATLPPAQQYDVVFGDAFNDMSVPYHLTTVEFARGIRGHLAPNGLYILNVIDRKEGDFLGAFARTLGQVFPHVYVLPGLREAQNVGYSTYIIVAANAPVPWAEWQRRVAPPFDLPVLPLTDRYLILTDNYAPVDNLLLPVFNLRWRR